MRFHWSTETDPNGKTLYALRDGNNCVHGWVLKGDGGFYGTIIARGLPDSGPYKARQDAADWVSGMLARDNLELEGAEFGVIPDERKAAA